MSGKSKILCQYLREEREKAGLTQKQVADALGYQSAQFVSNWERGISSPPIPVLKKLGALYSVSAEDLFEAIAQDTLRRVRDDLHREFYGTKTRAGARRLPRGSGDV